MEERASDFRDTLLELIDTSPEPMDHPSPDQWLAYHRGELSSDEEARLQEHLVRCRDCFDLAEGAAAFAQPDEETGAPGEGEEMETAALWRLLRPQLESSPQSPFQAVRAISAGPRRRPSWRFRLPESLAALFFVALVGMAAWNLHLRSAVEALRAPQPNAPIVDFSSGERLPTLPTDPEKTLSTATGPWVLVFHPAEELSVYRLVLRDAATGGELGSYELGPNEDLALTLQLRLSPGLYRLDLSDGAGGGAGKVLQTHLLRVTEPQGP